MKNSRHQIASRVISEEEWQQILWEFTGSEHQPLLKSMYRTQNVHDKPTPVVRWNDYARIEKINAKLTRSALQFRLRNVGRFSPHTSHVMIQAFRIVPKPAVSNAVS